MAKEQKRKNIEKIVKEEKTKGIIEDKKYGNGIKEYDNNGSKKKGV
ncbi:MAG TPA: hypothetical protein HA306_05690 [Methanosarcina sp.]|nr:hypothetical protein [Methanosarcina sp.]